ncbi:MAG: adenylyltransferase/cytidyltransferase family protein [Candidatus Neomarinimicrobiota bacterium]
MENFYSSKEWDAIKQRVVEAKQSAKALVFTNGCFDILHPGHKALLEFAKKEKGFLLIGLNSDDSVGRLKGVGRPINSAEIRAKNLLETGLPDAVVEFTEDSPREIIEYLEPDILIKGGDYTVNTIVGAPEVLAKNGKVLIFPILQGHSTTAIIEAKEKNTETN